MIKCKYEDILEVRRNEISNWIWSFRAIKPQAAVNIQPRPSWLSHKNAVLNSETVCTLIHDISKQQNVNKESIERQVTEILEEIGYKKSLKVIRYLSYVLTKFLVNSYSGIFVNYEALDMIKSKMGHCPVIFVPSHRSYADFILFSYVLYHYDIDIPAIAAGMDFQTMRGVGRMLRAAGAFFMRRSFNNDDLYWSTFREYINQIVIHGDLPIEFFIEGTRSRSNKSIAAKYGLINMILKPYFLSQVPDILFVPVGISYDRILEENLFSFELLGVPKPQETTSGFFKSLTVLKEQFGNAYLHFEKPISTRDFLEFKINRSNYLLPLDPLRTHQINVEQKRVVSDLANEILHRQQLSCVINYFNLMALIVNVNILKGNPTIRVDELEKKMNFLTLLFIKWKAIILVETNIRDIINKYLNVHKKLIFMNANKMIGLLNTETEIQALNINKLQGHQLAKETIIYSVPFITLQIYVNPVLHYFIDSALIIMMLRKNGKLAEDDLFDRYSLIRAMFSDEFITSELLYKTLFEQAVARLKEESLIICQTEKRYELFKKSYLEDILVYSIQPFLITIQSTIQLLQRIPEKIEEKLLISKVQEIIEKIIKEERENRSFIHPYCMNLNSIANCLSSLRKLNAIKKIGM